MPAHTPVLATVICGWVLTSIVTVSLQLDALVQIKLYGPGALSAVMVVVGLVGVVMAATEGLPAAAVHVPVPVAAMVAVVYWHMFWSGPASGLAVTMTLAVSLQLDALVQIKL